MMDRTMRILVVDDFSAMRRIVRASLRAIGLENVDEAEDGNAALTRLHSGTSYGLVVCDWNMPGMTGIELLRTVRKDAALRHTPFLLVTAEAKRENIMEAVQAGVDNYIVKPFTPQTFAEKLTAVFARRAA